MNFAHPVPLSLFQKTSQNDSNLFGSPRIGTTPGPAALFTLTPFLISPNPNGWSGQGGYLCINIEIKMGTITYFLLTISITIIHDLIYCQFHLI